MQSRYLLITGASRGIGYEAAKTAAEEGHTVIATARSAEALARLKKESGGEIETVTADVTISSGIDTITKHIVEKEILLDGVVHNAGLLINRAFKDLTDDDWYKMIDVNLMGPVRLTRSLLNHFNRKSHIVHISSMGGYQQSVKFPGLAGYSTAKGALNILAECLAVELADKDISVNALSLGAVQTEMLEEAFPGMNAPVGAETMGRYITDFVLRAHQFYNGKILPVSLSDPG